MYFISNEGTSDAAVNLALEEYCFRRLDPSNDYLIFYINAPSIIFGAHQNPWEEINSAYVKQENIPVIRRISGGGAVYHDAGNLNYSFITSHSKKTFGRFDSFTRPIIDALNRQDIPAIHAHQNVIQVNGKKVSGNAQFANLKRLMSHGTLLFNTDLRAMDLALGSTLQPVSSKGIRSKKREVGNVSDYLKASKTMDGFVHTLLADLSERYGKMEKYALSDEDWANIHHMANDKYRTWEWVYGHTPKFVIKEPYILDGIDSTVLIHIDKGIIKRIESKAHSKNINTLRPWSRLIDRRYRPDEVRHVLNGI